MESGFLLIDKPAGITSHDVIDRLRKTTGIKRIGHAGTLDPFATGLLLVAVGREATRELSSLVGLDKTYEAEFVIGATTETLDPEATEVRDEHKIAPTKDEIHAALQNLTGNIDQVPPMYSAIKRGGKKLYELARKGQEIEREPRSVTIHEFRLTGEPHLENGLLILDVSITCSSGTYVRALARDLGNALGTTGYVRALKRTSVGPFQLSDAQPLEALRSGTWRKFLRTRDEMGIK